MTGQQYDVFLSHNSKDKPRVETLAQRLTERGLTLFLDRWCLISGDPWQEALEEALQASASFAVFIGPRRHQPLAQRGNARLDRVMDVREAMMLVSLHSQNAARLGKLMLNKKALEKDAQDPFEQALQEVLEELEEELGLSLG